METDIYKSKAKPDIFIFIVAGNRPDRVLPRPILAKIGKFSYLKSIVLTPNSLLIGADSDETVQNLKLRGYHLQRTQTTVIDNSISKIGAAAGGGILLASFGLGAIGAVLGAIGGYWLAHNNGKTRGKRRA